jgi:hypothetical protein
VPHRDPPGRKWRKGESGNPGGRPARAKEFRQACRQFTDEHGFAILRAIAENPKAPERFSALKFLAEQAYGKPMQTMTGNVGGTLEVIVKYADR